MLYRRSEGLIVLLHAFRKTTAKLPTSEVDTAKVRWQDFQTRMNRKPRRPPRAAGHDVPSASPHSRPWHDWSSCEGPHWASLNSSSPNECTPQPPRSHGSSPEHTQPTHAPSCDSPTPSTHEQSSASSTEPQPSPSANWSYSETIPSPLTPRARLGCLLLQRQIPRLCRPSRLVVQLAHRGPRTPAARGVCAAGPARQLAPAFAQRRPLPISIEHHPPLVDGSQQQKWSPLPHAPQTCHIHPAAQHAFQTHSPSVLQPTAPARPTGLSACRT